MRDLRTRAAIVFFAASIIVAEFALRPASTEQVKTTAQAVVSNISYSDSCTPVVHCVALSPVRAAGGLPNIAPF
jgi:hypothetical protein